MQLNLERQLQPEWKEALHSYITGIIQNKTYKMLQINTMPDHLHMLIGFRPNENMSQLIQVVKSESTKFINDHEYTNRPFAWQEACLPVGRALVHSPILKAMWPML